MKSFFLLPKPGIRAIAHLCWQCRRSFSHSALRPTSPQKPATEAALGPQSHLANVSIHAPRSYGPKFQGKFTPQQLPRPIGMSLSPRPGENVGDKRSFLYWLQSFFNPEKHAQERKDIMNAMSTPYFRDWSNMRFASGKSFLAPPRLFRAQLSLFFPNLRGETFANLYPNSNDTTPILTGKVSVVSFYSGRWAENQTNSFTSPAANPALHKILSSSGDIVQLVCINYETKYLMFWIVRLLRSFMRKRVARHEWNKHFLIRRGLTDEIRESVGLLNLKTGYTYLVDRQCRIRWAGSGQSEPAERESLAKGLARLVEEVKTDTSRPPVSKATREKQRPLAKKL
ncbi:hypothetical protein CDD81_2399 [Ophiocordyceps australis]|uniref:Mitochondrial ATPase complex subunit ATP10 n=1 Tax=Ophiocordyceps australis TaxID=1399860 RepID=A0A2C5XXP6_9HYPO|nr:hypothetical protein CDD81_2399 [Ophiocordyceps australis]